MKKYIYTFLALVLVSTFWYSCTPPLEGITLQLPQSIAKSNVIIEFKPDNGAAGDLPKDLKVRIGGQDSSKVVSLKGDQIFKVKHNTLSVAASPSITPTVNTPIKFSVIVEEEGYIKCIKQIEITNSDDQVITVELTKTSVPPLGTTVVQQSYLNPNSGKTSSVLTVTTPIANNIIEKASLMIPAGITLTDEKGGGVGGNINVVVKKVDATKTLVDVNFPEVSKVVDKNNQLISDFNITPIVGVDIEMINEVGQKVKNFSGNIELKTEIPDGLKNTKTGKLLIEGDEIAISSFDEDTKVYKYEGVATITRNANGKLEIKGNVNHLTKFYFSQFSSIVVKYLPNSDRNLYNTYEDALNNAIKIFGKNFNASQIQVFQEYTIALKGSSIHYRQIPTLQVVVNDSTTYNVSLYSGNGKVSFASPNKIRKISVLGPVFKVGSGQYDNYETFYEESLKIINNPFDNSQNYTIINTIKTLEVELPVPSNFIEFQAVLKCDDIKKTSDANYIWISTRPSSDRVRVPGRDYSYWPFGVGKAVRNTNNILTVSTTSLKKGQKYDFLFDVGGISIYYFDKLIPNSNVFEINSTMPNILCK